MIDKFVSAPFWKAGFRPFFFAAMLTGFFLPGLWLFIYFGQISISHLGISPITWHIHEMYFGFGMAVLGGFLLTASKNWVKIRGIHGVPLIILFTFWLLERFVFWQIIISSSFFVNLILQNSFLISVVTYLLFTLIYYRRQDSFRDNYYFLIILPLLIFAKYMLLYGSDVVLAAAIILGIFRVAFAVMFERTITQFMKNTYKVDLIRNPILDHSIKVLLVILIFQSFLPKNLTWVLYVSAGALFLLRGLLWKAYLAIGNFGILVMFIGYFSLGLHLIFMGLEKANVVNFVGTFSQHLFSFLVMGVIIPSMFIRIIQGHTGRKIEFSALDKLALTSMILGGVLRLIFPQFLAGEYSWLLKLSGGLWSLCFLIILYRLSPWLFLDRVDGREH